MSRIRHVGRYDDPATAMATWPGRMTEAREKSGNEMRNGGKIHVRPGEEICARQSRRHPERETHYIITREPT